VLTLADIEAARERLSGAVYETPCAYSQTLSDLTRTQCFVKLENLQMTGSFKERGAANLLLQLSAAERAQGVVTASAGNHGLAVAFHGARLGIPVTIVMPEGAPLIKLTSARRYGVFVHPFNDLRVIAGQATIGLELAEQQPDLDAVVVAVGGGGLAAGVALGVKARRPGVRVIGVEATALPAMVRALEAGQPVRLPAAPTIADGIAVRQVGDLTLDLVRKHVDDVVTVSEEELANAILLLLEIEKTVVEGAGAAPLAALVNRPLGLAGARVVLVLSGGNIDVTMLSRIIERGLVKDGRLVRVGVVLHDRPGALSRLTALIAEDRANILQIDHHRAFSSTAIGDTEVELTLETSGREQIDRLLTRLVSAGYRVEERPR